MVFIVLAALVVVVVLAWIVITRLFGGVSGFGKLGD